MIKQKLAHLSDQELVAEFKDAASSYGQAFEAGSPKETNKIYRYCESINAEIKRRGPSAVAMLVGLLDADQPWVQYSAAAYTLDVEPVRASLVLAKLKQAPKSLGVAALTTLWAWEMKQD